MGNKWWWSFPEISQAIWEPRIKFRLDPPVQLNKVILSPAGLFSCESNSSLTFVLSLACCKTTMCIWTQNYVIFRNDQTQMLFYLCQLCVGWCAILHIYFPGVIPRSMLSFFLLMSHWLYLWLVCTRFSVPGDRPPREIWGRYLIHTSVKTEALSGGAPIWSDSKFLTTSWIVSVCALNLYLLCHPEGRDL